MNDEQLNLFVWADAQPTAQILDAMPRIISKIAAEPWPPKRQLGELVSIRKGAAA